MLISTITDVCAGVSCPFYGSCQASDDHFQCVCPICSSESLPVCADNGRTYSSECEMRRSACLSNSVIQLNSYGACGKFSLSQFKKMLG